MNSRFRVNSVVVGALFIVTMLLGMLDTALVMPKLGLNLAVLHDSNASFLLGVFLVFFMAIGIVGIATTLFPVVRQDSEAIAITYVSFRVVESLLLIFGALLYLFLMTPGVGDLFGGKSDSELPKLVSVMKLNAFQLSMVALGMGSTLLNYSFFRSRVIPRWLSVWGMIGYVCLFFSAVLSLLGILGATSAIVSLLYVPGGLWELFVFPIWLFVKGFRAETGNT